MTETTAAFDTPNRDVLRHQIETLALAVCRIRRLPDPDQQTLQSVVAEAEKIIASASTTTIDCLPDAVLVSVAAALV